MTKKAFVFGLLVAVMASLVGGATGVQAHNSSTGTLTCSPSVSTAVSGQVVTFTASYSTNSTYSNDGDHDSDDSNHVTAPQFTWSAVGGSPSIGTGTTFSTRFYTTSINQTNTVTVTTGSKTASCTVYVNGIQPTPYPTYTPYPYWTPYPYPYPTVYPTYPTVYPYNNLQCSPVTTSVASGTAVTLSAWGGNGTYSWSTTDGTPSYGQGSVFTTRFYLNGYNGYGYNNNYNYSNTSSAKTVTVYSGSQVASCTVNVYGGYNPYPTPTYSPYPYSYVTMEQTVRNTVTNQSGSGVVANVNDRLRFTTTVTVGGQYATNVRVQDVLPQYVNYIPGTTTVNGSYNADAITGGGINLGTLQANQTYTIVFDAMAQYAPYSTTSLNNRVYLYADNNASLSRTTNVYLNGIAYTSPTPTPWYGTSNGQIALTIQGRNISRGQVALTNSVGVHGGDTMDIVLTVRAQSGQNLNNVFVTDYLPAGLSYIAGSTNLNGYVVADGITGTGLNIGYLSAGQTATVKFSAMADGASTPGYGVVSVTDSAQARADGIGNVAASMQINLGDWSVLGVSTNVKTGPSDVLFIALAFATLASAMYAAYTQTDIFGKRIARSEIGRLSGKSMNFSR